MDKTQFERYKHKRKQNPKRKSGLLAVILVAGLGVLILFALHQFYISDIEITGTRVVSAEDVLRISNIKKGSHLLAGVKGSIADIFSLRHSDEEELLLRELPYIESIQIKSVFPGKLEVIIDERIEVAYISINDGYLLVDADGLALEIMERDEIPDIPIIEGISVISFTLGKQVSVDKPDYLNQAAVLLNAIITAQQDTRNDADVLHNIDNIRPVGDEIIYMDYNVPVNDFVIIIKTRISSGLTDGLIRLRFAIKQGKLENLGNGVLDMTSSKMVFTKSE